MNDLSGQQNIFRIRPDGTEIQQITVDSVGGTPAWSPDGHRLAYTAYRPSGFGGADLALRIYDLNSSSTVNVTQLVSRVMDLDPVWTPDQKEILFLRSFHDSVALYFIRPDGTGLRRLAITHLTGGRPDISPDGKRLVLEASDGLYIGDITGGNPVRIPGTRTGDRVPKWAPDGRRIAFARVGDGVQVINIDGSNILRLVRSDRSVVYDDYPTWSPDGAEIAFVGLEGLFVARVDVGSVRHVLSGRVYEPAWSR